MARQLIVELIGKGEQLKKTLGEGEKQTKSFGEKFKGASRKVGMGATAMGVGLTRLAGPLEDSEAKLDNLVSRSEEVTKVDIAKWNDDNRRSFQMTGLSIAGQNELLSTAITFGHDWATTQRIVATADDLAATKGISHSKAVEQLGRSMDGTGKIVDEFGLKGLEGVAMLDAMDAKIGGTSAEIDKSLNNKIEGSIVVMKDWAAQIGGKVGPALTALGPLLIVMPTLLSGVSGAIGVVRGAMTMLAAHPLLIAILAGGAIIAGLILLEKKFGVVSTAIGWVKDRASELWGFLRDIPSKLWGLAGTVKDALLWPYKTAFNLIARLWNGTVGQLSFKIPGWVPGVGGKGFSMPQLPTFEEGGIVPGSPGQPVPILAHAGETVTPAGRRSGGTVLLHINVSGVGMGRDFGQAVADTIRDNQLLGVA